MDVLLDVSFPIKDPVYGDIKLPNILSDIVQMPAFQRMKNIKQLGGASFVHQFKDANHTRYEHSLGTAWIANATIENLKKTKPELNINDKDILCFVIAALCHDLGHGPFSHVFQEKVLPNLTKEPRNHRQRSYEIFHKIWKTIVQNKPKEAKTLNVRDMIFIKELITGTSVGETTLRYRGREATKWILYKFLSNDNSDQDLCKFDYIVRDCLHLGLLPDDASAIREGKWITIYYEDGNPSPKIKYGDTTQVDYDLLRRLHLDVYRNAEVNAVEIMISDAIVWADEELKISINCHDLELFSEWDDNILQKINNLENTEKPKIHKAKDVLQRIENGPRYKFVQDLEIEAGMGKEEIIQKLINAAPYRALSAESLRVAFRDRKAKQQGTSSNLNMIQVFSVKEEDWDHVRDACLAFTYSSEHFRIKER